MPVLKELHWLPVKQRIIVQILLFTYKALKARAPRYISDFLVQYKPPRALRSFGKKLLQVPHFKLKTDADHLVILHHICGTSFQTSYGKHHRLRHLNPTKRHLFDQVFN